MSQRKSQTCADCARRKIKCDKIIPCNNCTKRGAAHLCRRADSGQTIERSHPSLSLSPSAHEHLFPQHPLVPEASINEKVLSLVSTLTTRVQNLEASVQRLESRKRSAVDEPSLPSHEPQTSQEHSPFNSVPQSQPFKHARTITSEVPRTIPRHEDENLESDSSSGQNGSDAEAEDAATVLEFLAWGRLKDSSLTSELRDPNTVQDTTVFHDKDVLQSTQSWGLSPSVVSGGGQLLVKSPSLAQIQALLPNKTQVILLCEYHADWLLFAHCSFHVTTFSGELDHFYSQDHGLISMTNTGLQWAAFLFAIMCGSITCAKPKQVASWGFHEDEQGSLAHQYYQAAVECLNLGSFQQNHYIYSVQAICAMTHCAHTLGYSNSLSVLLAAAVRIGQSLGLHRLARHKQGSGDLDGKGLADAIQKETGRRLWQQLAIQDWFSVPFSETYCVNRLHFSTKAPLHCDEETLQPLPPSMPTITTYGTFLFEVASLMPELLDKSSEAQTMSTKYAQVLHFDQRMRELVTNQLPSCMTVKTPIEPSWPNWVPVARRVLTITAAHKIIMIHRKFLGISLHDSRYTFTRRTCISASKTIINEVKQETSDEGPSPTLWTIQAFSVAAAIILTLDNFNRNQGAQESVEHRQMISDTISVLSASVSFSSIAARGTRLLTELLKEEQEFHIRTSSYKQGDRKESQSTSKATISADKSLNVSAFVKKFCEEDQPALPGSSPLAAPHIPLWLQDSVAYYQNDGSQLPQVGGQEHNYSSSSGLSHSLPNYDSSNVRQQVPVAESRQHFNSSINPFGPHFTETFDIKNVNWFDDLLGLAPSNSI